MCLLSPYIIQLTPTDLPKGVTCLSVALDALAYPEKEANSKIEHHVAIYRKVVATEVYRKLVDSKFSGGKLPRSISRTKKEMIGAEAALWTTVWRMLEVIDYRFNLLWSNPAEIFVVMVHENLLLCPVFLVEDYNTNSTTQWFRTIQPGINKKLQQAAREGDRALNPWSDFPDSDTFRFIDTSIALAGKSDIFKNELFSRMVKERQTLIAMYRKFNPVKLGEEKEDRQGRRTDIRAKKGKQSSKKLLPKR